MVKKERKLKKKVFKLKGQMKDILKEISKLDSDFFTLQQELRINRLGRDAKTSEFWKYFIKAHSEVAARENLIMHPEKNAVSYYE